MTVTHGVGFTINNKIVSQLAKLRLNNNQLATIISVYAPTLDAEEDSKEQFYSELELVLTTIPKGDKLILLGDFSARVGRDCRLWNNIIGEEGVGKANSNGILLLSKCAKHDLVILKGACGPSSNGHTPLRSQDGTLLKGDTATQQRWKEHFEQLLNRESMVTDDTILSIPQHPEIHPANPERGPACHNANEKQ